MKTGRRLGPVLTIALALSLLPLAWHVLSYATARLLEIDRVRAESEQHEWVMSLRGFFETHPPLLEGWAALLLFVVVAALVWNAARR